MPRFLLIPALVASLLAALAASVWFNLHQRDALRAERSRNAALVEANRALDEYLQAERETREYWQSAAEELDKVEGRDEALNPYERAVLDRVRTP